MKKTRWEVRFDMVPIGDNVDLENWTIDGDEITPDDWREVFDEFDFKPQAIREGRKFVNKHRDEMIHRLFCVTEKILNEDKVAEAALVGTPNLEREWFWDDGESFEVSYDSKRRRWDVCDYETH